MEMPSLRLVLQELHMYCAYVLIKFFTRMETSYIFMCI